VSILSGFVLSTYRNCFNTLSLIVILIFFFSFPATAKPNPHDNFYPDWDNVSSDTYCSIYSSYVKQNTLISSIQFNYWKKPRALPIELQAYFPEIIDYQKPTELKIFLNNGKIQHHIMYTIDRFERSVWLLNNNEEEMLTTLLNARLITVSGIGRSGKEYLLKFSVNPQKFMKEKEWLYNCMERDKNQLKYIKKTLLKFL
jgi:hypothetical protein